MKKKKKSILPIVCIILPIYVFLCLLVIHFFIVRQEGATGNLLSEAWKDLLERPFQIVPIPKEALIIIAAATIFIPLFMYETARKAKERAHYDPDTVQGDSKWLLGEYLADYDTRFTEPFGKPTHDGKNNMILSQEMFMSLDNRGIAEHNNFNSRNVNVFVIGGSGAGKTFGLVGPNIMQANCSYVVTDPSGELFANYGHFLEKEGYRVKCFNLDHMGRGNHYNPFNYVHSDKDIAVLVTTLIANTTPPEQHAGDPFWEKTEVLLLNALIAFLWHYGGKAEQNFSSVMKLLRAASVDENDSSYESKLDLLFNEVREKEPNSYAVSQYDSFKMGAGKTMKSILISVSVRLQAFYLEEVAELTNTDDINLDTIGDEKTALFVIIPTGDKTFNFLASLMYAQLFQRMYEYCENTAVFSQCVYDGNGEIVRTFRAGSEEESERIAAVKAEGFLKKAHNAKITEDIDYRLFRIKAEDGTTLAYRNTKEDAEKALSLLKNGYVKKLGRRRLPIHVRFLLDEFANTGRIPDFPEKVATVRKYEISVTIIVQSLQMMKNLYKEEWEAISGNCDNTIYLGGGADLTTTEWVSKLIGKETRAVMSSSFHQGNMEMSLNRQGVELYSPANLRTMPENECIIIQKSLDAYRGPKYNATKHPNWKYCDGSNVYTFNGERASTLYYEYIRAGEEGFEEADLNTSKHGDAVVDTPEEESVKDVKNKIEEVKAEEMKANMDVDGKEVIENPKDIGTEKKLDEKLNVKTEEDIKEVSSSLIDDNEDLPFDDFEYVSSHAGSGK